MYANWVLPLALGGELLVPEGQLASQCGVRLMAVHAEVGASAGDRRFTARTKIVSADYVARKLLRAEEASRQRNHQAHE